MTKREEGQRVIPRTAGTHKFLLAIDPALLTELQQLATRAARRPVTTTDSIRDAIIVRIDALRAKLTSPQQ